MVANWVSLGLQAIVVVDNCEYRLHERLVREVRRSDSHISLLTLDYNLDSVSTITTKCFKLEPMADEELRLLLKPLYEERLPDLARIVSFAQGFPQMAVLLSEARLAEDPKIGELTEDELANKLLWRRNENKNETSNKLRILQACSIFDVFGIEGNRGEELEFIAGIVGINIDQVYECVQEYSKRGIIDRRGRLGQVVPKPLAIRLAGQWWTRSRPERQSRLLEEIPESMIEGFCRQVEKTDFHTEVKTLTEKLCGPQAPFGQAEVLLSERGSRLFRAFVNVNPESTSKALSKAFESLTLEQLFAIEGYIRRNLLGALEKLCYHADIFPEAAWCMLLLASAENEHWSNNSAGMFAQLYQIYLSGTAAKPETRFTLLKRALDLNQPNVDMVILEALKHSISIEEGSRIVGAEYQGIKAPLEEWRPKIWQEIFDFWQEAFDLLLILLERGELQKQKVLSNIGHSIRGFVARGRIEMLDAAIKKIVSINGCYWPEALESIKDTFEFDSEGMRQEAEEALNSWLKLLSPDNAELPEKLKILVIDPPWEDQIDNEVHYVDIASENARALARELGDNIHELLPYLYLLLQGEQKQTYSFGYQLAHQLEDLEPLLEQFFEQIVSIKQPNPSFIMGIYRGMFEKSNEEWQKNISRLLDDEHLVYLYPNLIRTGSIQDSQLDILLDLIREGTISPRYIDSLNYGGATNELVYDTIAKFCIKLSEFDDQAS